MSDVPTPPERPTIRDRRRRRGIVRRAGERVGQFSYLGIWIVVFLLAGFVSAGATFVPFFDRPEPVVPKPPPDLGPAPERHTQAGLQMATRVVGEKVQVHVNGRFVDLFWAGVNLGSSVPGEDPGSVAATRPDYDRWFAEMTAMNVSVVRIYTLLSPAFYDALRDYNLANPKRPLYVLHGIWIPEDAWHETKNIWHPSVTTEMRREIENVVEAVHGTAVIAPRRGHASGIYSADVSPWMMGWAFGIEWDPELSYASIQKNKTRAPFRGKYFRAAADANAMESWMAAHMDYLAEREAAHGWSVPITFTNWDTTDPLTHPEEPLHTEDLVSIDAMKITPTKKQVAGYFASYHAYPYYPDFLRWQPSYLNYRRPRDGKIDPYAGYIRELRDHHKGIPLMITEFGQPTALGCAHYGPFRKRNQGCQSEQEAANNVVDMLDVIAEEGSAGAMVFMWLDEWFKFTWNTIDYERPGTHRRLWRNVFTNEEHYGVIAAEPGNQPTVDLDGADEEWENSTPLATGTGSVKSVTAKYDAENIYLRLKVAPELWKSKRITLGLDARKPGNKGLPGQPGVDPGAEMAVVIQPGGRTRMFHAAWMEALGVRFGGHAKPDKSFVPTKREDIQPGSGAWMPLRQILNYPYEVPSTGFQNPTETRDASLMPWGTADPREPGFDDRNLIMGSGDTLEIAIPWGMAGFADPSSKRIYNVHATPGWKSQVSDEAIEKLGLSIAVEGEPLLATPGFTWEGWDSVTWHERRKAGWPTYVKHFGAYRSPFEVAPITPTNPEPNAP
jgi:hypothetical protein